MGVWNTHGMIDDEDVIAESIGCLGITTDEMEALVEFNRREQWIWQELAKHREGQAKRKANLIAKHLGLRLEKWIDLCVEYEMEYEEEYGDFSETENQPT